MIDVIDFDQTDEKTPFLIMEYLHGESLASAIETEAPFPESRICHLALQICAALSAAHSRGIVHRDLKGDNVFLTTRGDERDFVKVLDFGIAKLLYADDSPTQTGQMLGTPLCMAPEQARGRNVDARVDVYALGVLLFQMCTGRPPFDHQDALTLIRMHLKQPAPSPRQYNPAASHTLEEIILRCLQKSPADRFASMDELSKSLRVLAAPSPAMTSSPRLSIETTSPFIILPADGAPLGASSVVTVPEEPVARPLVGLKTQTNDTNPEEPPLGALETPELPPRAQLQDAASLSLEDSTTEYTKEVIAANVLSLVKASQLAGKTEESPAMTSRARLVLAAMLLVVFLVGIGWRFF